MIINYCNKEIYSYIPTKCSRLLTKLTNFSVEWKVVWFHGLHWACIHCTLQYTVMLILLILCLPSLVHTVLFCFSFVGLCSLCSSVSLWWSNLPTRYRIAGHFPEFAHIIRALSDIFCDYKTAYCYHLNPPEPTINMYKYIYLLMPSFQMLSSYKYVAIFIIQMYMYACNGSGINT